MRNIKLIIEYDGTNYHGFQIQKKHNSIQSELEKALSRVCNEKIKITGSGRTDSGVHAKGYVANFKTSSKIDLECIQKGANSYLPADIVVLKIQKANNDFHARFSAKKKHYRYSIWNSEIRSPLQQRFATQYIYDLDVNKMQKAAQVLVGKHDFKSFGAKCADKENTVRTIFDLKVKKKGNLKA